MNEISFAVIALAFLVLVIYLVIVLVALKKSIQNINDTLAKVNKISDPIGEEALELLRTSNALAQNTLQKTEKLDPLFETVSHIGHYAEQSTKPLKNSVANRSTNNYRHDDDTLSKIDALIEVANLGIQLWQKYKKGR